MKQASLLLFAILLSIKFRAQQVFFQSDQIFSKEHLTEFYSSIAIHGDLLIFSAADYNIYAYNKKDAALKWSTPVSYKSNSPVYSVDNNIFAGVYLNSTEHAGLLDTITGKIIKIFPFGPWATQPVIKNGILYGTALYEGGRLLAYDMKNDTVLWSQFLAHGYSTQPYYSGNRIMANAEVDNWVSIDYNGKLTDTTCKIKTDMFVEGIPCVGHFYGLTHDRKQINKKTAARFFGEETENLALPVQGNQQTFLLHNGKLVILGDKLKVRTSVELASLTDTLTLDEYDEGVILKANDEKLWMFHTEHLFIYNLRTKQAERITDLSAWTPHRVLIDEDRVWIISRKDGLLYGLQF